MARTRKTPKPKLPAHERIDRAADPHKVYPLLDGLVAAHRPDLDEAKIAVAWRYGLKRNKDGQLVLGKCKKAGDLDKQFHDFDFVILLNSEAWKTLSEIQQRALMHHELEHAAVSEDQNGNPKRDARGRLMYRVRKHDIEEFRSIVKVYGCYKSDIEEFVRAAVDSPKPPGPTLFDAAKAAPVIERELRAVGYDVTVTGTNGVGASAPEPVVTTADGREIGVPEMLDEVTQSFAAESNGHANGHANGSHRPKNRVKGR